IRISRKRRDWEFWRYSLSAGRFACYYLPRRCSSARPSWESLSSGDASQALKWKKEPCCLLIKFLSFCIPDRSEVDIENEIGIILPDQVVLRGSFYSVLEGDGIRQRGPQGIDAKSHGYALVID